MDRTTLRFLWAGLLVLAQIPAASALNYDAEVTVRGATFEFFAPGATVRSKGLVGTAFAIGPNEFVTAAHLLDAAIGGRFKHPQLLDSRQIAYPIADILQYSELQDYVVFSVRHPPRIRPLSIERNTAEIRDLYFAGWTPRASVDIKQGRLSQLTHDTGSEKSALLQFSGPVWGAAGGGPVLNESGRVIGIVQAVTRERDSYFAVPIDQLSGADSQLGRIHATQMLRNLMPAVSEVEPLRADIPLPASFDSFSQQLQQLRADYFDRNIGTLLQATRHNFILTGAGAEKVCNLLNGQGCECKARTGGVSGNLVVDNPRIAESMQRFSAGEDVAEKLAGISVFRFHTAEGALRPVSASHRTDLLADAGLHLRMALQAHMPGDVKNGSVPEMVAQANADRDEPFVDFHGRAWRMRTWTLLDRDLEVQSLVRELSGGYVVLTRTVPTSLSRAAAMQLQFIANIVFYGCEELSGEGDVRMASYSSYEGPRPHDRG